MQLTHKELLTINGGAFTATWLNAISRAASTIYKIGQNIGSAIRIVFTRNYC